MHPILLDYAKRFNKPNSKTLEISGFFTSLDEKYLAELPYLYDIEVATDRLKQALEQNQKICIYSDYDTDAVTATGTMYWGLTLLGFNPENLDFYAPDRFTEGYGMNPEAISMLCDKYDLIISVDCGINSVNEAKICQEKGIDLIITDHHHLSGELPKCLAVINPRLSEYYAKESAKFVQKNNYLSSSVTGVGVAWFVVVWLAYRLKYDFKLLPNFSIKELNQLLGFVAIGTVADCQSILDETNRLLVKSGVKMIQSLATQSNPNQILKGLWLLLDQTGLKNQIANGYNLVSSDLGFTLSPILNSSGRLSHASHSIEVMLAGRMDSNEAESLISKLIATNNERKLEVSRILSEVESEAKAQFEAGKKLIWVANSGWSKGLIGLLASRLVNRFDLPVVVIELPEELERFKKQDAKLKISDSDLEKSHNENVDVLESILGEADIPELSGFATASLRAPEGYNLPVAMNEISELFVKFGGHPGAAGFSASIENLSKIEQNLEKSLQNQKQNQTQALMIDYSLQNESFKMKNEKIEGLDIKLEKFKYKKNYLWLEEEVLGDLDFWNGLLELEPYGQDFQLPTLVFPFTIEKYETLSQNLHLKFETNTEIESGKLSLIWFNYAKSGFNLSELESGKQIFVVGRPQQNAWKNKLNWQIIIEDLF